MEQGSSSNRTWNSPLTANGRAVIYVADEGAGSPLPEELAAAESSKLHDRHHDMALVGIKPEPESASDGTLC